MKTQIYKKWKMQKYIIHVLWKIQKGKKTEFMFYQKMQKRQNAQLQNQFYLGGVTGNLGSPSGFPVRKLINALNYLEK